MSLGRRRIKVDLLFFEAGGGHRRAAEALKLVMDSDPCWDVRLMNIQEVFDPIDLVRRLTGMRLQDLYNLMLKKKWTWAAPHLLPVLHAAIRYYHTEEVHLLEREWRARAPDLVVSLIPHFIFGWNGRSSPLLLARNAPSSRPEPWVFRTVASIGPVE